MNTSWNLIGHFLLDGLTGLRVMERPLRIEPPVPSHATTPVAGQKIHLRFNFAGFGEHQRTLEGRFSLSSCTKESEGVRGVFDTQIGVKVLPNLMHLEVIRQESETACVQLACVRRMAIEGSNRWRLCENAWIGELQKLKFTMRLSEVMHEEIH